MLRFITTADTEILATAAAVRRLPAGFPEVRCASPAAGVDFDDLLTGARVVLVRVLGGRRGWPEQIDELARRCQAASITLLALGGEAEPDAEMTALSTAPAGAVAQAGEYLRHGDVDNVEQLLRFLADTFLLEGFGFAPPREIPALGLYREIPAPAGGPTVGICFYRSHYLTQNTDWVDTLTDALAQAGAGVLAVWSYSLRPDGDGHVPALERLAGRVDALIVTMLATGGSGAADAEDWNAAALAALDVPVFQAVCATQSRAAWEASDTGLSPLDAATQVAIPEFDGRLLAGVVSFKEREEDSPVGVPVPRYVGDPERCARVAGLVVRHARLTRLPAAQRRVAVLLTAFPTKHARIGMAVGLDTPASALALFDALAADGMVVDCDFSHGDQLMHALIAAGGHDPEFLSDAQLAASPLRLPVGDYLDFYATLPESLRAAVESRWGPPPGDQFVADDHFIVAGLELGNVLVAIQPPRGYGEDPVAIYHDPELPPTHHYLACYRFIDAVWGADAIVHLGKHGTLEWLPGKMLALSAACAPDAALGDIPLIYPFVVNDPGEGVQAKRRAHALIVDHLVPPMMRVETYDELAELEALLDEYARLEVLDPAKLPALAARIWTAIEAANLQADLDVHERPEDLGALVEHIDGYLCEVKDIQIKDGLHILGRPPEGEQLHGLLSAMLDTPRGEDPMGDPRAAGLAQRIGESTRELTAIVAALNGRFVEAGPSGAPTRGRHDVLPTGRNFYSIDPRAMPSELAWEVGQRLAEALLVTHRERTGTLPKMVGLVAWGTAAMRTGGDDVAEILALLGVRPVWNRATRRVTGVEVIGLEELGRPRIDVTVRISGFFRDAFPHAIALIDDAVGLVAALEESDEDNFIAAHVRADAAALTGGLAPDRTAGPPARIFGSKPGTYGAGLLQLLETQDWRDDQDIARVYEAWGGYAYGRHRHGEAAGPLMRDAFARIELAVKNVDSSEHDILDSDDYYQYHGGMVATVRALTGREPAAYLGNSSRPDAVVTRTLAEETRRVFRARVANPRWIASMIRHGYKGAAELSATVDYLFGYDAMAGVVDDWMYEQVAERYLLEESIAAFMSASNPWAARAIAEKLLEGVQRGLWAAPEEATLAAIRERYLALEGELEGATA
ncbi:cobaltochelatase subunit CobN [Conexibacter sp. DBS9H8]|uniref:cobaltochelatase subunit CobN n=1 Tax=Conexibacter sp. DBS9H8 TaxID=2937801 RepID=UPI00200ED5D4|nr:cobaltochelatase subunit CobN [Conexibacter sp. DBS9H8]